MKSKQEENKVFVRNILVIFLQLNSHKKTLAFDKSEKEFHLWVSI